MENGRKFEKEVLQIFGDNDSREFGERADQLINGQKQNVLRYLNGDKGAGGFN